MVRRWLERMSLVSVLTVSLVGLGDAPARPSQLPFTTTGLTPAQVALVVWASRLYDDAALPLPPIDFVGHATTDACSGRSGMQTFDRGRSTIHICTPDAGPAERHLFLHEMAHAWDRGALTEDRRVAFLQLRSLQAWSGGGLDWHDLGAEQAAEIIVWGLMDQPVWPVYLEHRTCPELQAGYRVLTGRPPLRGFTDFC